LVTPGTGKTLVARAVNETGAFFFLINGNLNSFFCSYYFSGLKFVTKMAGEEVKVI
jgi:ATP-dependent 26S proteasome regulatory subunit